MMPLGRRSAGRKTHEGLRLGQVAYAVGIERRPAS